MRDSNIGGNFQIDQKTKRAEFEITQSIKNVKLLYFLRKNLGFGKVQIFSKDKKSYCRWYTSQKKNILLLIFLLNGNLILEKRQKQFFSFLEKINMSWNLSIQKKPSFCQVSLDDAWLSGFCDADAGFYTNIKTNFKGQKKKSGGYFVKFFTKFYITQCGEEKTLMRIFDLVGATNKKLSIFKNEKISVSYNRLEICESAQIEILIRYFEKYPLRGSRHIDFLRWVRVHAYKKMKRVVSEKAAQKLATLLRNLEEPFLQKSFDFSIEAETDKILSQEEISIFIDLPLNQKHPKYIQKNF